MTTEIKKLPSGFFAVFVDGIWMNASCKTIEQAEKILSNFTEFGVDKPPKTVYHQLINHPKGDTLC